jgi:hypothetical protein
VKVLVTIPHFYDRNGSGKYGSTGPEAERRVKALADCITGLRQSIGPNQAFLYCLHQHVPGRGNGRLMAVNDPKASVLDIAVCTTGESHLLERLELPRESFHHQPVKSDPMLLGFGCHQALRANLGRYDYYCYVEDDLLVQDPLFLQKLSWFTAQFGEETVLLPHRFETGHNQPVNKLYIDGPVREDFTARWQDINEKRTLQAEALGSHLVFQRWPNPHSGCFFLNARQMERWVASPSFGSLDTSFAGPLESAATLGIMRNFRIYKPSFSAAGFFEVKHLHNRYLGEAWHHA